MGVTRRRFIGVSALGGAAAIAGMPVARAEGLRVVGAGESEYLPLVLRGYNRRYGVRPDNVFLPSAGEQVREALARALSTGKGFAVRSGGHCFEDFVDNAGTRSIIDLGQLNGVRWDAEHRAFSVDAGAELKGVYEALHRWGVTLPAGICLGVGMGGHVPGGGYGPLSRRFGLVADYLYGVEVVIVGADGEPRIVLATKDGPHADLWWAHTGGGGGNFGVVTRFLFRSPDSDGAHPATALPKPPGLVMHSRLVVPALSESAFVRLLGNYIAFFERYSAPGNRFAGLYAPLSFRTTGTGFAQLLILLDADAPDARTRYDEFVAAVLDGVDALPVTQPITTTSYADTVSQVYYAKAPLPPRVKVKTGYLRRAYTEGQLRTFYRHITDLSVLGETELEFLPFGGAINAVAPDATAMPVRDSFMKMLIHTAWRLPEGDERHIAWARELYSDVYAETGGVPVPNERNGGSYINYPDPDLADPRWNRSGLPWHHFYYGDNYPKLLRAKETWDPRGVFRHALSIGRPG
ncbi:FAD-binding oxidoreductase [Nocardia puris]|uniref:FAD-binding oxidoreductase n=1 Tax=Nocardia puris TaxID=208602 RepID=UPI0018944FC1|nr:FAD-binding protein [Nocardia puris]MBF6462549.1 FAD-binding oxidoreductase [Nocardia puris]